MISEVLKDLALKAKQTVSKTTSVAMPQAWNILQLAVAESIQTIQNSYPDLTGKNKKEMAMGAISDFYDQVFLVVDFPFVPKVLQPIIQRYVKQILMILVGASIDAMVATFKSTGIFSQPDSVNNKVDVTPKISDK